MVTREDPQFFTELGDVLTFRVSRVWFSELFDSAKPLIRLMSRVSLFFLAFRYCGASSRVCRVAWSACFRRVAPVGVSSHKEGQHGRGAPVTDL